MKLTANLNENLARNRKAKILYGEYRSPPVEISCLNTFPGSWREGGEEWHEVKY